MTATYTLDGDAINTVRSGEVELTQSAELGAVGSGRILINDHAGTLVTVGQKDVTVDEDDCSDPIAYRGFVAEREFRRGPESTGASREISVQLEDLNSMLGFRGIVDGSRPATDTVASRGAWLMANAAVAGLFIDNGRCDFSAAKGMDKADYTDQYPGDVLADMALAQGGVNYYVRDFGDGPELVFRDDNASTDDTSPIHISNVPGEDDQDTIFYPSKDFTLRRNPGQVKSRLAYHHAKGRVVETRAATATDFNGERFGTASNSNVKNDAEASEQANAQLWQIHTEEDVLEGSILVPSSHANLLNHGDRVGVRIQHATPEGYYNASEWAWCRVLELTRKPLLKPVGKYELRVRLSPQEAAQPAAAIVQRAFDRSAAGGKTLVFPNPVTVGNLLVFACSDRSISNPASPNTGVDLPRFGAGAWTKVPNVEITTIDPRAGCAIWVKEADSTERECWMPQSNSNMGIWEISVPDAAATIAGITAVSKTQQTQNLTMAIGSLGTAAVGTIGILVLNWADFTSIVEGPGMPAVAASGWTIRLYDSAYEASWYLENSPYTVIADTEGTGAALAATVTKSALSLLDGDWCGAAILIEPL